MLMTPTEIDRHAHQVCRGLTDQERIALGVAVVRTVLAPEYHCAVHKGARELFEHGEALLDAGFDLTHNRESRPRAGRNITHEQSGALAFPGAVATGPLAPRAWSPPRWRAAWGRVRAAEERFANSIWGDVVAGTCLCMIVYGLIMLPLVFGN